MDSKTIVITGGSDGIGAAAARQLKRAGHNVVLVGRNQEKTERLAALLQAPYHLADYADLAKDIELIVEKARIAPSLSFYTDGLESTDAGMS